MEQPLEIGEEEGVLVGQALDAAIALTRQTRSTMRRGQASRAVEVVNERHPQIIP